MTSKKTEALAENVVVKFGGATYTVPSAEEWDIDVLEAVDSEKITHALKSLLGAEQYAAFRKAHSKVKDLSAFFEAVTKAVGTGN